MAWVLRSSWPIPYGCAPLRAARGFAQPPQGAEVFRLVRPPQAPLVRIVCWRIPEDLFIADSIRWLSRMGVSSRRKRPVTKAKCRGTACSIAAAEELGSRVYGLLIRPRLLRGAGKSGAGAALGGAIGAIGVD